MKRKFRDMFKIFKKDGCEDCGDVHGHQETVNIKSRDEYFEEVRKRIPDISDSIIHVLTVLSDEDHKSASGMSRLHAFINAPNYDRNGSEIGQEFFKWAQEFEAIRNRRQVLKIMAEVILKSINDIDEVYDSLEIFLKKLK